MLFLYGESCECSVCCVRFIYLFILHYILHKLFYFYRNLFIASVAFVFLATAVSAAPVEGMMFFIGIPMSIFMVPCKKIELFNLSSMNLSLSPDKDPEENDFEAEEGEEELSEEEEGRK